MLKSMNKNVVFISDLFAENILGGAELNNEELIDGLRKKEYNVLKKRSHEVSVDFLKQYSNYCFIISNFVNLPPGALELITKTYEYIIYEHDHKYLKSRDPAVYPGFKAPKDQIINLEFYKNAKSVFCQSKFHSEIVSLNTGLENIQNVSGNLWDENTLNLLEELSFLKKEDRAAIMNSPIHHKNTHEAVRYCSHRGRKYRLVSSSNYEDFLKKLGSNDTLVFFPSTPETLSRIVCEARMMGMKVVTNNLVGASKEEWFKLKGKELIDVMRGKRTNIIDLVEKSFENPSSNE